MKHLLLILIIVSFSMLSVKPEEPEELRDNIDSFIGESYLSIFSDI